MTNFCPDCETLRRSNINVLKCEALKRIDKKIKIQHNENFCLRFFQGPMSPKICSVSEGFSNWASNSRKYSRFFIASAFVYKEKSILPTLFSTESYNSVLQPYVLSSETLACRSMRRVDTESHIPASSIVRIHRRQWYPRWRMVARGKRWTDPLI
jgi:hypothetical protein